MAKSTKKVKKEKEEAMSFPVKRAFWFKEREYKIGSTIELSNVKTIENFKLKKYI